MNSTLEQPHPFITVVIPALNEERWIGDCLNALLAQSYPRARFEIVVVDNGSDDRTAEIAQSRGIRLLHECRKSAYAARNTAILHTRSDWLAFTDADCIAELNWLQELSRAALATGASLLSGLTVYRIVNNSLGNLLLADNHRPQVLKHAVEVNHCVAGGNMFVSRQLFRDFGEFKEIEFGSDIEFSKRVSAAGYKVCFAPSARVIHQCDLSNVDYVKRSFRERYGQVVHVPGFEWQDFFRNFLNIPWRPGFRAVRPSIDSECQQWGFFRLWLYRWLNRWAAFCGSQWALTKKLISMYRQAAT